jgi:hypothetical protein
LNRRNLTDEVDIIVSRECLFYVAQAYEILESYLYDQVAEYIIKKSTFHLFVNVKSNSSTPASIRRSLKALNDRKNNRHLLGILRANSSIYAKHEKVNIYDRDFSEWFEMLGEVRHCITHMRMELTNDTINAMPKSFKLYFQSRPRDNGLLLFLEYDKCSELMSNIADYVFFVYKSIVETCSTDKVTFETIYPIFSYSQTVGAIDPVDKYLTEE